MQNCNAIARTETCPVNQAESTSPLRVVIVDDSENFRVVLRELLQMMFDVEVVAMGANGFEALELTAEHSPDLLILDVNMPVLDGIVAASLISAHFPTTTILMMSGDEAPVTRERCLQSGAYAFSPKGTIARQFAELQAQFS